MAKRFFTSFLSCGLCCLLFVSCSNRKTSKPEEQESHWSETDSDTEYIDGTNLDSTLELLSEKFNSYKILASESELGKTESYKSAQNLERGIETALNILYDMREDMTALQYSKYDKISQEFQSIRSKLVNPDDLKAAATLGRSIGENLDLCTRIDGDYRFFSPDEWENIPMKIQSLFEKIGVVIDNQKDSKFLVSLNPEKGKYTYFEAMEKFGTQLPSMEKAQIMGNLSSSLVRAISTYGGDATTAYCWTRDIRSDYFAWPWMLVTDMAMFSSVSKEDKLLVRTIQPYPASY